MSSATPYLLNALQMAINVAKSRPSHVYLRWKEKITLDFAEMLAQGNDEWINAVYQHAMELQNLSRAPVADTGASAVLEDGKASVQQMGWDDVPDHALNKFAPIDAPDVDDQALDTEDPAPLGEPSPFDDVLPSDDDDAVSIEDDGMIPELCDDMVRKHEFNEDNTWMLYRVRGFPGRHSGRDLEEDSVGVSEALFRHWKSHRITNKHRLAEYLINTNNIAGHFNRLLWPQFEKKGYKDLLAYEKNGRLTDGVIARRVAAAQRGEVM
ncbi:hypothetical protein QFC20_007429 [Naganishia adeliensis]|uniref:Uncharacterized protein n=1 Tax=Naganishia adeliensis TaxID=92952 RepID=A0ACC2UZG4_9TREE|nr:hypothetical protein QFC20_007429 [Naganishia adeliensis]